MAHDPLSAGGNGSSSGNGSAGAPHLQTAENGKVFPYPGIPTTCDGAEAVRKWLGCRDTETLCRFPPVKCGAPAEPLPLDEPLPPADEDAVSHRDGLP